MAAPDKPAGKQSATGDIDSSAAKMRKTADLPIGEWVGALGGKVPTPGGGAAAAVAAAVGAASGAMAAIYTTRKKDEQAADEVHGTVAAKAKKISEELRAASEVFITGADDDASAYADLQSTWKKDCTLSPEEKKAIEARALEVPVGILRRCHLHATTVAAFLPQCNPNIISDAKVALHLLAGAACAAFQTVLVNRPPQDLEEELRGLLAEMRRMEEEVLTVSPKS